MNKKSKARSVNKKEYDQNAVKEALDAISTGMSLRKAAETYGIPKSTLQAKHTNKIPVEARRGPTTYLTPDEELIIVSWTLYCGARGFPVTKCQLLDCVQKLVVELGRETAFKDNRPGRHWMDSRYY